jgi:hypothetical protein
MNCRDAESAEILEGERKAAYGIIGLHRELELYTCDDL